MTALQSPITETGTDNLQDENHFEELVAPQAAPRKYEVVMCNVLFYSYLHLAALYGLYLAYTVATWKTILFNLIIFSLGNLGVTAGAHRLWTHRAYKAKMPLQIILMIMHCFASQNTVFHWVREHRMHHKYCDTDADPHNATRGFFYSHIGWILVKKHEEIRKRGRVIDISDVYTNPVLMFQKKYRVPILGTLCYILPTLVTIYFFGESLSTAWHMTLLRSSCNLHAVFLINSASHLYGTKPYDKTIKPTQNLMVSLFMFGEGFHNYHHTFPWDYKAAELGNNVLNWTTLFIDFFAWLGWAYELKTVSDEMIKARLKEGDGNSSWGVKI